MDQQEPGSSNQTKQIYLYRLFPNVIWSHLSFFIPREFFVLCEKCHLPYHYVYAIDTLNFDSSMTFYNLAYYKRVLHLKSSYSYISSKITPGLRSAVLQFRRRNLSSLSLCQNLRTIELEDFDGKIDFLAGMRNLHTIIMDSFTGESDKE